MDADTIARIAERKIQDAIDEGKFDNLPGKGRPIIFDEDTSLPADLRMASKVLKNAGVLPDWMQVQKEIQSEQNTIATLRTRLIREHETRRARLTALPASHPSLLEFAQWHTRSRAALLRKYKALNTSILKFSIMAPSTASPFRPIRIDDEMASFDRDFPLLHATPAPAVEAESDSTIRRLARARYQDGEGGGRLGGWTKAARALGLGKAPEETSGFDTEDIRRSDAPQDH